MGLFDFLKKPKSILGNIVSKSNLGFLLEGIKPYVPFTPEYREKVGEYWGGIQSKATSLGQSVQGQLRRAQVSPPPLLPLTSVYQQRIKPTIEKFELPVPIGTYRDGRRTVSITKLPVGKFITGMAEEPPEMSQVRIKLGKGEPLTPQEKRIAQQETTYTAGFMVGGVQKVINPVSKLLNLLEETAKPARGALEKVYKTERGKRFAAAEEAFKIPGEAGFRAGMGKMKGKLAETVEAFPGLKEKLTQVDVDGLYSMITKHPYLNVGEKMTVGEGLGKLFRGEIPQKSEIALMEDVFGSEVATRVLKQVQQGIKLGYIVKEGINIPRVFVTTGDLSGTLRQAIVLTVAHPIKAAGALLHEIKSAFSQKVFDDWLTTTKKDPFYKLGRDHDLYISEPFKVTGGLAEQEERFMTRFATTGFGARLEKIPILGNVLLKSAKAIIRGSERAYVGYLNKLRFDVFKSGAQKFIKDGYNPATNEKLFRDWADFVNNASGRGKLPFKLERIAEELNTVFFAPRLQAARVTLLNPVWYAKMHPAVRKEAIKSFAEFIGTGMTVLVLAKLNGMDVETNCRSSDSGKMRRGDTRWDMWGGYQQWVRVFCQLATNERKSTTTGKVSKLTKEKFPFETRFDVALQFARGKLAPIPSLALELMEGQKLFGEKLELSREIAENIVPLYIQDIKDAMAEFGPEAIFTVGIPAFFGMGVQTFKPKSKKPVFTGKSF